AHLWPSDLVLSYWGPRIPRPYVTELFVLASLCGLLAVVRSWQSARRPGTWAMIGLMIALAGQGDLFSASIMGTTAGLLGAVLVVFDPVGRRQLVKCALAFGVSAMVALIPFFYQRWKELPDLADRLGIYSVPRILTQVHLGSEWQKLLAVLIAG